MQHNISIADISQMEVGKIIPSFKAKIAKLTPQKSGAGAKGPWTMQIVTLKDGTGVIEAKLWNRDNYQQSDVGREYIFASTETKKGLGGVKRDVNEYNGKTTPMVTIQLEAEISPVVETVPRQTEYLPDPSEQRPVVHQENTWAEVDAVLTRQFNLRIRCEQAAIRVADVISKETGYAMGPEEIERRATSFFIELNRKQVTAPMTSPVWKKTPQPKLPPSQMTKPPEEQIRDLRTEGELTDDVPF